MVMWEGLWEEYRKVYDGDRYIIIKTIHTYIR